MKYGNPAYANKPAIKGVEAAIATTLESYSKGCNNCSIITNNAFSIPKYMLNGMNTNIKFRFLINNFIF